MQSQCKICGHEVVPRFRVNKDRIVGEPVRDGVDAVDYLYCGFCGFLFSRHLDSYSHSELSSTIYDEYYWTQLDPDDRSTVPLTFIRRFMVGKQKRILDYGCGHGHGVSLLRAKGYDAFGYDIGTDFVAQHCSNDWDELPSRYDFIFSFEVVEHLVEPVVLFEDLDRCLTEDGVLFCTTYLYQEDQGRDFWYIAPRNGHVSLFSRRTLQYLSARYGLDYISLFRPHHHLFLRSKGRPLQATEMVIRYGMGTCLELLGRMTGMVDR